jgi:hypothetical protein
VRVTPTRKMDDHRSGRLHRTANSLTWAGLMDEYRRDGLILGTDDHKLLQHQRG